jgi:hypothetical protein
MKDIAAFDTLYFTYWEASLRKLAQRLLMTAQATLFYLLDYGIASLQKHKSEKK